MRISLLSINEIFGGRGDCGARKLIPIPTRILCAPQ